MSVQKVVFDAPFKLESGELLPSVEISYHTYGKLHLKKNNVIWIAHALTANSNAADWWTGLVGDDKVFDTKKYFIVCANLLGSCYGSSGPLSTNPHTHKKYHNRFPMVTIRDMVQAHILLKNHLGIKKIVMGVGGSMGGYQIMEWAAIEPGIFKRMILLSTSAKESAWGIAIHTAQRLAIEADATWKEPLDNAGQKGLKAARAIGMLTYRNYEMFAQQQSDEDSTKLTDYKASSYIIYQGEKLIKRFNAYAYWLLTKAMDSHNMARGRKKIERVLQSIKAETLIVGISSDYLCPIQEQKFLAKHLPHATLKIIDSKYGHDGFLIEWEKLTKTIHAWLKKK
jgi:homoserine O-acetyltransferase